MGQLRRPVELAKVFDTSDDSSDTSDDSSALKPAWILTDRAV
jgi:hypothetical protein